MPDLPWCMRQWLRLPDSARWDWALDTIYGLQDSPGEFHKTGFSAGRLRLLLRKAGFTTAEVTTRFDHGMRSIRALASGGGASATPSSGTRLGRWLRKQSVFLFYRIASHL